MENTCPGTPVQDERGLGSYSPVSDPWGDFALTQSSTDQLMSRLKSLETIIRDQHMTTRENTQKPCENVYALTVDARKNMQAIAISN